MFAVILEAEKKSYWEGTGGALIANGRMKIAITEMSAASGFSLLDIEFRNPMGTFTFGAAQLILHALGKGCKRLF